MNVVESLALAHYLDGIRLREKATRAASRTWRRGIDPQNIERSLARMIPALVSLLSGAQHAAAEKNAAYLARAVKAYGVADDPLGTVNARALAGIASDGRPLDTLLRWPGYKALRFIKQGMSPGAALGHGLIELQLITATQVQDAGRVADQLGIVARPQLSGYVRMLSLPSCARCAILAGRVYKSQTPFLRHPRCDCRHIPVTEDVANDMTTDPMEAFRSGQVRGLSEEQRKAIEDGADISQVVNARRKGAVYSASGREFTRSGRRRVRLTPEQIYREAKGSREEAIRLLKLHGYIL